MFEEEVCVWTYEKKVSTKVKIFTFINVYHRAITKEETPNIQDNES